jgi:hypothetical protein
MIVDAGAPISRVNAAWVARMFAMSCNAAL